MLIAAVASKTWMYKSKLAVLSSSAIFPPNTLFTRRLITWKSGVCLYAITRRHEGRRHERSVGAAQNAQPEGAEQKRACYIVERGDTPDVLILRVRVLLP